jgi:hypothetical protein
VVAVSAPVVVLPLVALVPLQPPEAVHEVALVLLHVRVDAPPDATLVGFAVNFTVGAGGITVTVAAAAAGVVPLAPEQVSVKLAVAVSAPVVVLPLVALVPLQPPEAVHTVALALLHVSVDALPDATLVGFAVSFTVGSGGITVTMAVAAAGVVPLAPEQVNV